MYHFYKQDVDEKKWKRLRREICSIHDSIPETEGCVENIQKDGGCGAWCCVSPDTIVFTPNGPTRIGDLREGDIVDTRLGERRVIRAATFNTPKPLLAITLAYGRTVTLTADHRLLAWKGRKDRCSSPELEWVRADHLLPKNRHQSQGHYIAFPKKIGRTPHKKSLYLPDTVKGCVFNDRMYSSSRKKGSYLPASLTIDEDIAWLVGLYVAKGSLADSVTEFHINQNEIDLIDRIKAISVKYNLNTSERLLRRDSKSFCVRVFSRVLVKFLELHAGKHCDKKQLSKEFINCLASPTVRRAFLQGHYDGDGCKSVFSMTTTSKTLCHQLDYLYQMENKFLAIWHSSPPNKKPYWVLSESYGKYKDYIETPEYMLVPVRKIKLVANGGLVCDIEVEESHSFSSEVGELHNCQTQSPSVLFAEFLLVWRRIQQWSRAKTSKLFLRCIVNFLNTSPTKGCVFWNKDTKLCEIHEYRPYNCRVYSQIPEEEFKPRFERLKVLYPESDFRPQCSLTVKTKEVTAADTELWFKQLELVEKEFVPASLIHDNDGGSYRHFHDHVLLKSGTPQLLTKLVELRTNGTAEQRQLFIEQLEKLYAENQ